MIDAMLLGFELTWTPGFRGILAVLAIFVVLCGSVFVILSTNSGVRLGFHLALTGFAAWMFVMGIIWSLYGIGPKGSAPSWKVVDTVRSEPASGAVDSRLELARSLPLPAELPDPVELRDASEELLAAFPPEQRDPTIGDLVTVDDALHEELDGEVAPWRILETSNKYTGETQAVVAEALGPNDEAIFESSNDYVVVQSFLAGGKKGRTDDSLVGRATWKAGSLFADSPTFYAAVQLQQVIPQEAKPGQAPPLPVADPDQPVITVILQRVDTHQLRVPQIIFTIAMGIATAVLCLTLHNRDKLSQAQRAAGASA